jgi:hypothetical protein
MDNADLSGLSLLVAIASYFVLLTELMTVEALDDAETRSVV